MAKSHYTSDSPSISAFDVPVPGQRLLPGTRVTLLVCMHVRCEPPHDGGILPSPFGLN